MEKAIKVIEAMNDVELMGTWNCLFPVEDWNEQTSYGITVEDWATLLYSYLSQRGLPSYKHNRRGISRACTTL